MRIVFAGTPAVAVPTLEAVVEAGHDVAAVITRPDAPTGRKRNLTPSPVAARADALGLDLIKTSRIGDDQTNAVAQLHPDLGVVVAYGAIIPQAMLDVPRHGWINLHFSLLPAWRGAAPVQRSILAGESATGVSVFQLEAGLDTGPTFVRRQIGIGDEETSGDALERLSHEGTGDVLTAIDAIAGGVAPTPQRGEPTHAAKLTAADGRIDWSEPSHLVAARVRGATPEPGATTHVDGERLKVVRARRTDEPSVGAPGLVRLVAKRVLVNTGDTAVELLTVQPSGKKPMAAADWLRGAKGAEGTVLA